MKKIIPLSLALFAMLFGAGNIVFPLDLGRLSPLHPWLGALGFCITSVFVPLLGLIAVMLSQGDYKLFLAPLGKPLASFLTLFCMLVIGPFGLIPRCITISYSSLSSYLPFCSLLSFSIFSALLLFLSTVKKSSVIDLLGKILGPLKVFFLLSIIIKGVFFKESLSYETLSQGMALKKGLLWGYQTCDLLGTIFLSSLVITSLKRLSHSKEEAPLFLLKMGIKTALIAGVLLSFVYTGFVLLASHQSGLISTLSQESIFSILSIILLGKKGAFFANMTVALACLTTSIALTAVFASYLHQELFKGVLSYKKALLVTSVITTLMATLGFSGVMKQLAPIIEILYPFLILYTVIIIVLRGRELLKTRSLKK